MATMIAVYIRSADELLIVEGLRRLTFHDMIRFKSSITMIYNTIILKKTVTYQSMPKMPFYYD